MKRDCLDWPYFSDDLEGRLEYDLGGDLGGKMISVQVEWQGYQAYGRWLCPAVVVPRNALHRVALIKNSRYFER